MKLRLLAFGIARDILGGASLAISLDNGATVQELKNKLKAEYSDFDKLAAIACAVNMAYVPDSHELHEGDEVVIIPPVSGG